MERFSLQCYIVSVNFQVDQEAKVFGTNHEEIQTIIKADTFEQLKNLKNKLVLKLLLPSFERQCFKINDILVKKSFFTMLYCTRWFSSWLKKIFVTDHEEIQSIIMADTFNQFQSLKNELRSFKHQCFDINSILIKENFSIRVYKLFTSLRDK